MESKVEPYWRFARVRARAAHADKFRKGIQDVADSDLGHPFGGVSLLVASSRRFSLAQHRPHVPGH